MDKTELCKELAAVRKENRKLQNQLEHVKAELEEWQHCAILLTPEEIFEFYRMYREQKKKEREESNAKATEELSHLTVSIMDMKKKVGERNEA